MWNRKQGCMHLHTHMRARTHTHTHTHISREMGSRPGQGREELLSTNWPRVSCETCRVQGPTPDLQRENEPFYKSPSRPMGTSCQRCAALSPWPASQLQAV